MSGRPFTRHARQRALERYNLALADEDFALILDDAMTGRAPCMQTNELGSVHMGRFEGRTIIFAVVEIEGRHVLTTFLPPDYFVSGNRLKHNKTHNRAKQKPHMCHHARREGYSRAKFKREGRGDDA